MVKSDVNKDSTDGLQTSPGFEDDGYETIDSLPTELLDWQDKKDQLIEEAEKALNNAEKESSENDSLDDPQQDNPSSHDELATDNPEEDDDTDYYENDPRFNSGSLDLTIEPETTEVDEGEMNDENVEVQDDHEEVEADASETESETDQVESDPVAPKEKKWRVKPKTPAEKLALTELQYLPEYEFTEIKDLIAIAEERLNPSQVESDGDSDSEETPKVEVNPEWADFNAAQLKHESDQLHFRAEEVKLEAIVLTNALAEEKAVKAKVEEARELMKKSFEAKSQAAQLQKRDDEIAREAETVLNQQLEQYAEDEAAAMEKWKDLSVDGSPFNTRFREIVENLEERGDPRVESFDRYQIIGELTEKSLKLESIETPVKKSQPSSQSPLRKPKPASKQPLSVASSSQRAAPSPAPGGASRGTRSSIDFDDLPTDLDKWKELKNSILKDEAF